jgi:hypothetical protein
MADEIGPVEYLIVAFPGNQFRGEIAPALADLVEAGTIRIIDVAFVSKDEDGAVAASELTELDPGVREGLENLGIEVQGLFNEDDLMAAGKSSSRIRRRRCSSGRTSGRNRSPRRCATPAGSCSTSGASRTRQSRRRATMRSRTPEKEI